MISSVVAVDVMAVRAVLAVLAVLAYGRLRCSYTEEEGLTRRFLASRGIGALCIRRRR